MNVSSGRTAKRTLCTSKEIAEDNEKNRDWKLNKVRIDWNSGRAWNIKLEKNLEAMRAK